MGRNAKQIPADILGMASAASVLSGSTAEAESRLASMASTFGRILELGKVGSKDIKRLVGAGVPALDILSEELGVSKSTVKALLARNLLDADLFTTALTSGMQKRFGGYSEQVLHTLGVEQKKLDSGMAALAGKAFQNMYDTTASGLGGVNQIVRSDSANMIAARMNEAVAPVTNLMQGAIKAMQSGDLMGAMDSMLEGVKAKAQGYVPQMEGVGRELGDAFKTGFLTIVDTDKKILNTAADTVQPLIDADKKILNSAGAGIKDLTGKFPSINAGHFAGENQFLRTPQPMSISAATKAFGAQGIGMPMAEGVASGFAAYLQGDGKKTIIEELEKLLQDPRIKAMLEIIKRSEVGSDSNPYARLFGKLGHLPSLEGIDPMAGGRSPWPGTKVYSPTLHKMVTTHTLGPYQAEPGTYRAFANATGVRDVTPHSQDLFAVWDLLKHPEAFRDILRGDVRAAMGALKSEWESFAVNPMSKTNALAQTFNALVNGSPVTETNPMPVRLVAPHDIMGGASIFSAHHRTRYSTSASFDPNSIKLLTDQPPVKMASAIPAPLSFADFGKAFNSALLPRVLAPMVGDFKEANAQITHGKALLGDFRAQLLLMGITSQNMGSIFEHSFSDAFSHIGEGWKGMVRTFVVDFAQAVEQMVIQAEAAKLATLLFGDGEKGGNKGWINGLLKVLGIGASAAAGGVGGGSSSGQSSWGAFGFAGGHATGGYITGPGTGTSDSISARLSNGEYVMSAQAVRNIGVGSLDAMNSGRMRSGGDVQQVTYNINVHPSSTPTSYHQRRSDEDMVRQLLRGLKGY
jgi:tape measure domain-containing protein